MASLQDQLLKAGLVDKNTAKKVSKAKHKANKASKKSKAESSQSQEQSTNAMKALHAERDRELNRKKQEAAEAKAIQAQIRQLIEMNKIDTSDGEIAYNFAVENKVKTLYVTEQVQSSLGNGQLAIVRFVKGNQSRFDIVAKGIADKIAQRNPEIVVYQSTNQEEDASEDDPYADFKVPDDLMW